MKTLSDLRKEIDTADEEIINALAKRFSVVEEIARLKKNKKIEPLDKKRWNEVLQKVVSKTKQLRISEELIKKIYDEIHQASLKIEENYE
jgi:chorismate mutase